MKSIGARITMLYAIVTTVTLACLFIAGHYLLQNHLIRQLDTLNEAQFKHLKNTLGPDYATLTPAVIDDRIREATESASALFYIDMHGPMTNRFFRSHNLHEMSIPDLPGQRTFTADLNGIGELRVGEFLLPPFEVMVATPLAPVWDVMAGYRKIFMALLFVALLVCVGVGYFVSNMILNPVRVMQATANRIRSDNLNERIPVADVKDEISQLARFLNQMFDRLETSFSEIRRFAAEASHELKTPLSLVRLHAERLVVQENLDPAQRELVHVQLEELARVNHIIDELLFLSRADAQAITLQLDAQRADLFLHAFAQDASALAEHHGNVFMWAHEGDELVEFEANRIRQVLLNLLANALNVSPPGGVVRLDSRVADGQWTISVEDQGPGLTPQQRERIFERFVRFNSAKGNDRGSGLGLAISRSIVQLHRGRIFATEGPGGSGLRVVIELPTRSAAGAGAADPAPALALVDDG